MEDLLVGNIVDGFSPPSACTAPPGSQEKSYPAGGKVSGQFKFGFSMTCKENMLDL